MTACRLTSMCIFRVKKASFCGVEVGGWWTSGGVKILVKFNSTHIKPVYKTFNTHIFTERRDILCMI
jgi:hypothetical protein